jgi:hypothetical protein
MKQPIYPAQAASLMKRMFQALIASAAGVVLSNGVATAQAAAEAPSVPLVQFPRPDRIKYDGHCLMIDGHDVFIFSGSFHYFRCPKELWADRFAKIKAAGFNAVETYVAWNWSERQEPKGLGDDSQLDLSDFKEWLTMAHERFGLYTIIRPGPYICAEWDDGGFPRWLANKKDPAVKGRWLRTDDPMYLAWSKHWFDAVCPIVVPEQITHKPKGSFGTILLQIENEYDFYPQSIADNAVRERYLTALYKMVRNDGIDVPIFTCWTKQTRGSKDPILRQVFDASNFYSRWDIGKAYEGMIEQKKSHPDAPGMVSELQGGWFAGVGGKLAADQDGVNAQQCAAITLDCINAGGTILNYYMGFGGTNFGDWNGRGITTTYDYDAPIRECGGVDEKYRYVWGIGHMLQKIGPLLARNELVDVQKDNQQIAVGARRNAKGDLFLFFRNPDHVHPLSGTAHLTIPQTGSIVLKFDLEPFGMRMLHFAPGVSDPAKAELYPELPPELVRPAVPQPIRIASAKMRLDPGGDAWVDVGPLRSKVALGVNDAYFTSYRSTFTLTPDQLQEFSILRLWRFHDDPVVVQVNGKMVGAESAAQPELDYNLASQLKAGENSIIVLYDDPSLANFGDALEEANGLKDGALLNQNSLGMALDRWRVKVVPGAKDPAEVAPEVDDSSWDEFVLNAQTLKDLSAKAPKKMKYPAARILYDRQAIAVFRTSISLTEPQITAGATTLTFDCLDDMADVYVNGTFIGHSSDWSHPWSFDAGKALKPGKNSIAVVVTNASGEGGITKAVHLVSESGPRLALQWKFAAKTSGESGEWWKGDLDVSDWQSVALDTTRALAPKGDDAPAGKTDALATWYRSEFELPAVDAHAWIPWNANIDAAGQGFLYLNDHELGRYYDVGPQREYFLPECWLNFGPGKKNVLAMSLRPTDHGVELRALQIQPYAQYAEKRDAN